MIQLKIIVISPKTDFHFIPQPYAFNDPWKTIMVNQSN